jgi:hypothetical protein
VEQPKLKRMTDGKIPRLLDLTMRPVFSGRKTTGALEAHENGLRFRSTRGEECVIIYDNIKNALYQPCEKVRAERERAPNDRASATQSQRQRRTTDRRHNTQWTRAPTTSFTGKK